LQRGQRALQGLADQPSLPIGDRVEGLDGLRRCPGVELHRPASAIDARRPPWDGLAACEPRGLGEETNDIVRDGGGRGGFRREARDVEGIALEDAAGSLALMPPPLSSAAEA